MRATYAIENSSCITITLATRCRLPYTFADSPGMVFAGNWQ